MHPIPIRTLLSWGLLVSLQASVSVAGTPEVKQLTRDLSSPTTQVRREAARALAQLEAKAAVAVPALVEALGDRDEQVQAGAVRALARLGPEASTAAPKLATLLRNGSDQLRYRAAHALGRIGAPALPVILEPLRDESPDTRAAAARALSWMGPEAYPATADLVGLLADRSPQVRAEVTQALSQVGSPIAARLKTLLRAEEPRLREGALRALAGMSDLDDGELSVARSLVEDPDPAVRAAALIALAESGMESGPLAETLGGALSDRAPEVREAAEDRLLRLRPEAAVVEVLSRALDERGNPVAFRAVEVLGRIGPAARPAAATIARMLESGPDQERRRVLSKALGRIGPGVVEAVRDVLREDGLGDAAFEGLVEAIVETDERTVRVHEEALDDPSPNVRAAGALVLARLALVEPRHSQRLIRLLGSSECRLRMAALQALGELDVIASEEVGAILRLLEDPDDRVRAEALRALPRDAIRQFSALVLEGLQDPSPGVRLAATHVLARSTPEFLCTVELTAALDDPVAGVRAGAARALGATGALVESVPLALIRLLRDSFVAPRVEAAAVLGSVVNISPTALDELAIGLRDSEVSVRHEVAASLGRLGKAAAATRPRLIEALQLESNGDTRLRLVQALVEVTVDRLDLLPVLIERLSDSDTDVRKFAASTIAELGEAAQAAAPALFEMVTVRSDYYLARMTLRDVKPQSLGLLREKLRHPNFRVRRLACDAVRDLREHALDLVDELQRIADDEEIWRKAKTRRDRGLLECARKALNELERFRRY